MAIRTARPLRPLLVVAAALTTALVAPSLAAATPTTPHRAPTISSVQQQLRVLAHENIQLVEQYNQTRILVAKRQTSAVAASQASARASKSYARASVTFTRIIQAQYENGPMNEAGALFDSNSGGNYVDRLNTLDLLSTHDADVVGLVRQTRAAAAAGSLKAQRMLDSAKAARDDVAVQRASLSSRISNYKQLLASLTAAQQRAVQRSLNPSVPKTSRAVTTATAHLTNATPAAARAAVQFALNQVGKPYVYGAAGPGSYDCSGLTMASWNAGGVSLPHSAADQYNYGHHVPVSALQPGDLVFMYSPIGHVTIYIGNGQMVSAPTEGQPVSVVSVSSFASDIVGATRLV